MSTAAKGRADHLQLGDWNALCAQCGRKRKGGEMLKLPQGVPGAGLYVCPEHWDYRHPQEYVRGIPDKMAAPWVQNPSDGFLMYVYNVEEDEDLVVTTPTDGSTTIIINVLPGVEVTIDLSDVAGPVTDVIINNSGLVTEITDPDDPDVEVTLNNFGGAYNLSTTYSITATSTVGDSPPYPTGFVYADATVAGIWGGSTHGSCTPAGINGLVYDIGAPFPPPGTPTQLYLYGTLPSLTSITLNGTTMLGAAATHSTVGGLDLWQWTSGAASLVLGANTLVVST